MRLADTQLALAQLIKSFGEHDRAAQRLPLTGGSAPAHRLQIHQRHFRGSLVDAFATKFPATRWLLGDETFFRDATTYVRAHAPETPVIAEYGARWPMHLQATHGTRMPWIADFAMLEWHVGQVSVAISDAPVTLEAAAGLGEALMQHRATLQPGVRYLVTSWPVDALFQCFANDTEPARFEMHLEPVAVEIRGARGDVGMQRITAARMVFRTALQRGESIECAATEALAMEGDVAIDGELLAVIHEELIVELFFETLSPRTES